MNTASPDQTLSLGPGELVDGYLLMELIAKGGGGEVYKALQVSLDRVVCLKFLRPDVRSDERFLAAFDKEAKVMAQLVHPNVLTVHDRGVWHGHPYMVVEYVDGSTLHEVNGMGKTDRVLAGKIIHAIGKGIGYIHSQGLLHRDIKPGNVMLSKTGQIKVADFGIAHMAGIEMSEELKALGTLKYCAPEVLSGGQDVDVRADIYSLAVTYFVFLSGYYPDCGTPLSELCPGLHPDVEALLRLGLEFDPANRPTDASKWALELARAVSRDIRSSAEELSPLGSGNESRAPWTASRAPWMEATVNRKAPPRIPPAEEQAQPIGGPESPLRAGAPITQKVRSSAPSSASEIRQQVRRRDPLVTLAMIVVGILGTGYLAFAVMGRVADKLEKPEAAVAIADAPGTAEPVAATEAPPPAPAAVPWQSPATPPPPAAVAAISDVATPAPVEMPRWRFRALLLNVRDTFTYVEPAGDDAVLVASFNNTATSQAPRETKIYLVTGLEPNATPQFATFYTQTMPGQSGYTGLAADMADGVLFASVDAGQADTSYILKIGANGQRITGFGEGGTLKTGRRNLGLALRNDHELLVLVDWGEVLRIGTATGAVVGPAIVLEASAKLRDITYDGTEGKIFAYGGGQLLGGIPGGIVSTIFRNAEPPRVVQGLGRDPLSGALMIPLADSRDVAMVLPGRDPASLLAQGSFAAAQPADAAVTLNGHVMVLSDLSGKKLLVFDRVGAMATPAPQVEAPAAVVVPPLAGPVAAATESLAIPELRARFAARGLPVGQPVTAEGVVVMGSGAFVPHRRQFVVATGGVGIVVDDPDSHGSYLPKTGERVRIVGAVSEHRGMLQMKLTGATQSLQPPATPQELAPVEIAANQVGEAHEGALVVLRDLTLVRATNERNFLYADASGHQVALFADADTGVAIPLPPRMAAAAGIVYEYDDPKVPTRYVLYLRSPADVVAAPVAAIPAPVAPATVAGHAAEVVRLAFFRLPAGSPAPVIPANKAAWYLHAGNDVATDLPWLPGSAMATLAAESRVAFSASLADASRMIPTLGPLDAPELLILLPGGEVAARFGAGSTADEVAFALRQMTQP